MKKYSVILCMAMFLVSMPLMAGQYVADADNLYEIGGLESCKKAVSLYEKAPGSYESDWKCARACQCAGDAAKDMGSSGWKEETAAYGKKGMEYAAKAIELNPNRVEGHYYYGCCAGTYSDGVSVVTVLKEGLLGKIRDSLETAYSYDKKFDGGGPMQAMGRYWTVLPWPLNDNKKALKYLRENQQFFPDDPCGQVFLAEVLLKSKKKANKQEAKALLEKAAASDDQYYSNMAKKDLQGIK